MKSSLEKANATCVRAKQQDFLKVIEKSLYLLRSHITSLNRSPVFFLYQKKRPILLIFCEIRI